jgi:hypothetical protein
VYYSQVETPYLDIQEDRRFAYAGLGLFKLLTRLRGE